MVGGGAQRFPHISFPLILDPSPARGEGSNKVTFVRLRFANRTYVADGIAVNRTGVVSDHIPGAVLSPLPSGEGRVRGSFRH